LHIICTNICYNLLSFFIINCDNAHLPEMEWSIREKLIKIIGKDIVSSCMKLGRMKNEGMCVEILLDDLYLFRANYCM